MRIYGKNCASTDLHKYRRTYNSNITHNRNKEYYVKKEQSCLKLKLNIRTYIKRCRKQEGKKRKREKREREKKEKEKKMKSGIRIG